MSAIQLTITVIIVVAMGAALFSAYRLGYTKGVHDLTEEIDEGIKKLKEK